VRHLSFVEQVQRKPSPNTKTSRPSPAPSGKAADRPRFLPAERFSKQSSTRSSLAEQSKPATIDIDTINPTAALKAFKSDVAKITSSNILPEEWAVLQMLEYFYQFSNLIVFGATRAPDELEEGAGSGETVNATSTLLDLDEESGSPSPVKVSSKQMSLPFREQAASTVAELLYTLVRDPKVFISPDILSIYVRIQCLLGKPEYLPEIFYLYAHKPIPQPKTTPIKYRDPWPKSPKYAIPLELSDAALEAAIVKKDMSLALAVIDTTVATPAFRRNKVLRKASAPILAVSGTPVIAYAGAQWLSEWQNTWDPEMAKSIVIAGSLAYIGTLTTIGFVAVTTYNDQMRRVVWRPGTRLRDRWMREEERAYFDRVALAWGFQKEYKWGEEQGEEWEMLREVIGLRDMILDKTDLMEGMQ